MSKAMNNGGSISKKTKKGKNGVEYTYWEARVTTGYDPLTGRQIQRSFTAKTQAEARQKMQTALNELNNNNYFEPKKITLSEWLDLWLSDYCGNLKYLTVKKYKSMCDTHIKPVIGSVKLSELNMVMMQKFFNSLAQTAPKGVRSKNKALAPKTIRDLHGIMSKALNTAVQVSYIQANPVANITLPKVVKDEMHPLTDEQMKEFLKLAADDEHFKFFKLILFTGLRESECLGLTWDCVDFEKGTLKIYRQLQKRNNKDGGYCFAPLKNSKTRTIKPPASIMQMLKDRRAEQMQEKVYAGEGWTGFADLNEYKTALIFTRADGSHLGLTGIYNHYKSLAERVGAPESRIHDLRHPYVKHTTKIFSLRLKFFQVQPVPDALRKTRGAFPRLREEGNHNPFLRSCNKKLSSWSIPQLKISLILYAISMRLSGYTSTLSMRRSVSSAVSPSELKTALAASCRLSCRVCSSCFCFACANTTA